MTPHATDLLSDPALFRICDEFLEMPGMRLTLRQARRLWSLDEATCVRLLDDLVAAGFLCRTEPDTYSRIEGAALFPRPRMANATLRRPDVSSRVQAV